jgi:hypothetical protein
MASLGVAVGAQMAIAPAIRGADLTEGLMRLLKSEAELAGVLGHEIGHAVIREFDLMVLGNEETMADAFATHLLTEHFPEHAVRAISARVGSSLDACRVIVIGDTPRDIACARADGVRVAARAAVWYGFLFALIAYLASAMFLHLSYQRYFWAVLALASAALWVLRRDQADGPSQREAAAAAGSETAAFAPS